MGKFDRKIIYYEILMLIFTGIVPVFISYSFAGIAGLEKIISAFLAAEWFVVYVSAMSFSFFIYVAAKYFWHQGNQKSQERWDFWFKVTYDLGIGYITIVRLGAGAILGYLLLYVRFGWETFDFSENITLFAIGSTAFLVCIALSHIYEFIKRQQPKYIFRD